MSLFKAHIIRRLSTARVQMLFTKSCGFHNLSILWTYRGIFFDKKFSGETFGKISWNPGEIFCAYFSGVPKNLICAKKILKIGWKNVEKILAKKLKTHGEIFRGHYSPVKFPPVKTFHHFGHFQKNICTVLSVNQREGLRALPFLANRDRHSNAKPSMIT